jgi:hypothetical protein
MQAKEVRAVVDAAIAPLLERIDAQKIPASRVRKGDVRIEHAGTVLFGVRLIDREDGGITTLLEELERELGGPLLELDVQQKRDAVRLLEKRGAFEYRRSVETIAEALGVTRFTVYNYLNRLKSEPTSS